MDINQPSRLRSYSQLKLLLSLSSSLDPQLAEEAERLVERVSMNPLQNDANSEIDLAYRSYEALRAAARSDGALRRTLDRDRRKEFAALEHGRTARVLLRTATVLTAGLYRHREDVPRSEQLARLDTARRVAYHTRFLEEVMGSTPVVEVVWDIDDVRRSLRFLAEHGAGRRTKAARLAAGLFERTQDLETRRLGLQVLAQGGTAESRAALARIAAGPDVHPELRALSAEFLARLAPQVERRADAAASASMTN
jgi:hypothetical protein